jgi:hypothetical protein
MAGAAIAVEAAAAVRPAPFRKLLLFRFVAVILGISPGKGFVEDRSEAKNPQQHKGW